MIKKLPMLLLKSLLVLIIAIGVFIAVVFIVNMVSSKSEQGKIQPTVSSFLWTGKI